ncbi:MAG: hypothetical protein ACRELX_13260 [Longimicrobiales bacterium]
MSEDRTNDRRDRRRSVLARLERAGLSARSERWLNYGMAALVALFTVGWSHAVIIAVSEDAPPRLVSRVTTNPLAATAPPPAAFLLDAALRTFVELPDYRGISGDVRIIVRAPGQDSLTLPDSLPSGIDIGFAAEGQTPVDTTGIVEEPTDPGIWNLLVRMRDAIRPVPDLHLITLVPLSEKRGGRIGGYRIGDWPWEEGGTPRSPAYAPPAGVIRVTPENQDVRISAHFRLGDFLTKGQADVWPKYVVVSPRLLDKLELVIDELEAAGHPVENVGVISGFRTPSYNESGGNPAGRGALSRHMYGDAMDFYIDNDGDGRMDDLDGDGRIGRGDGRVIAEAAERVERKVPELVGGLSVYAPTGGHSCFVHVDTRGYRARW